MRKFIQCKLCGVRHPIPSGQGEVLFPCKGCGRGLRVKLPIFDAPESAFWSNDTIPLAVVPERAETSAASRAAPGWNQGRRFGPYQVIEEIARGGMGTVYKARHVGLNRVVALKVLQGVRDEGAEMAVRFRNEARTTANLHHPNIVPVFDVGVVQGHRIGDTEEETHYYAMEYVDGQTLDERMFRGTITLREIVRILASVARALEVVHRKGIVHRDVKPGNIILDGSGKPYLMDFGLAKRMGADVRITRPGMAMGTPAYMSPEQAEGDGTIDGRADVYSLGAILFESLAGRPPFKGASLAETLMQLVSEEKPSLREHRAKVDPLLEAICMKCMEKDRSNRYLSALELAEDLEAWVLGRPVRARPLSLRDRVVCRFSRAGKKPFLLAGAAAAALAGVFLYLF